MISHPCPSAAERRLLVLYGSETGNSQDVAERVVRESKLRHYSPVLMAMESYDVRLLPSERLVIFVASTTGQGDEPRNMKSFWRFLLRRSLSASALAKLSFAVFGLGDSGYQKYNVTAKKLFRRMQGLGAIAVHSLGLGDDQHPLGYDGSLTPWLSGLWSNLRNICPLPPELRDPTPSEIENAPLPQPRFCVEVIDDGLCEHSGAEDDLDRLQQARTLLQQVQAAASASEANLTYSMSENHPTRVDQIACVDGVVFENNVLTSSDALKQVHQLEFRPTDGEIISYAAGDVLGIIPQGTHANDAKVARVIERFGLSPDDWIRIYPSSNPELKNLFPPAQLKYLIAGGLDIDSASPRRYFFEVMSHFAQVDLEKERLAHFSSAEGAIDLYKYNQRERRTVIEIFDEFPSLKPSIEWFFQVVPHIFPRYYSISSSPAESAEGGGVQITVASAEWTTPLKRKRVGLCSSWLNSLVSGTRVRYTLHKGSISLPELNVPMLLIGPGTGIAPFRSFVHARLHQAASGSIDGPVGESLIFFGCRDANHDYLYKDEWTKLSKDPRITGPHQRGGVIVGFSRMQDEKKRYVQDCILDEAKRVWSLLESGAKVFVAGSAEKMPAAVHKAIQTVVRSAGSLTEEESLQYMVKLETSGRYFVDAW
jgi:sulfite reductase alpha subunit-like flavoprotein